MTWYDKAHRDRGMKSFSAFIVEQGRGAFDIRTGKWVCRICRGTGQIVASYERPDVNEGYKFADRVACPSCGGTGVGGESDWRVFYRAERADYILERKKERETRRSVAPVTLS